MLTQQEKMERAKALADARRREADAVLPANFGDIDGKEHPDSGVARGAMLAERERCAKAVSPAAVFEVLKKHFAAHDRLPNIAREISALIQKD